MTTIKEKAQNYQPPITRNVSELKKISVNEELHYKVVKEGEADEFSYEYFKINDEEFRVPISVIVQLQEHVHEKPDMTHFKVTKKGEGMNTKYTVIPL